MIRLFSKFMADADCLEACNGLDASKRLMMNRPRQKTFVSDLLKFLVTVS